MAEIISFPTKKVEPTELDYLRAYVRCYVIDLTQLKKRLSEMQEEIRRLKAQLQLKVIERANAKDSSEK